MKNPIFSETCRLKMRGVALIRYVSGLKRLRPHQQEQGFTLVVTLLLMILLTVIAVGLLTLSSISLRTGQSGQNQAEARANARFAMMMALAQLQRQAGPDQRATAVAGVVRPAAQNTNWVGVWSSTERASTGDKEPLVNRPVVGTYEDPAYLTDLRESATDLKTSLWKDALRLGWLVSGDNPDPTLAFNATTDVKLVNTNSVATPAAHVWAPKVKIPGGSYAYWVSDENAKANVAVNHPYSAKAADPNNASDGGYYRLAGAEPPNVSTVTAGAKTPYAPVAGSDSSTRSKLVHLPQVGLVAPSTGPTSEDIKNNFHDLTTCSMSVLSNNRAGGLKSDLTTLLEQSRTGASRGITMSSNPLKVKSVKPETQIIDGNWHKYSGPRFDHLYAWYRLMDELDGMKIGNYSLPPRYLDARATTAERGVREGFTINTLARTGGSYSPMPITIQPQLVDFKLQFDFSLDTSRAGGRAIRAHVYPRLVLWNPYNVKLTGKRYVVMAPFYPWDTNFMVGGALASKSIPGDPNDGQLFPGATNGFAFTVEATEFEPGECLVFTPKTNGTLGGNSDKYNGTDLSQNLLSATKAADRQNFYFPSGWCVDPTVVLTNPQIPYGPRDNPNDWCIADGQLGFLFKRAPSAGSIAPASLYSSQSYATISRHIGNYQGHGDYFWWYVPGMSNRAANDAPFGFVRHEDFPERNPPRLWYTEARQRWFDEGMEQQAIGQKWGNGAAVLYNVPLIAAYNVRAPLMHRSQFCFYDDWTKYSPGGFMYPWASERTFGTPAKEAPMINGKAMGSPWGLAGEWSGVAGRYPMFDLPSPDVGVFSLADFQHAEIGFQTWQPSYVIGHSLAEARADRDATARRTAPSGAPAGTLSYVAAHPGAGGVTPNGGAGSQPWHSQFRKDWTATWNDLVQAADQPNEIQCYDIAYETNHYLWDDYFLSTIPFKRKVTSPQIIWDVAKPLPNSRLVINPLMSLSTTDLKNNLSSPPAAVGYSSASAYPFHHAAWFLMNDGGFNVNSASVEAWRAVLSTNRDLKRPTKSGTDATGHVFSRLLMPRSSTAVTGTGALQSDATWNGVRSLTDADIEELAKNIVLEVKLRGPFLSLADFVNRRLTPGLAPTVPQNVGDMSLKGPLQAAIDRAEINKIYHINKTPPPPSGPIPPNLYATDRAGKTNGNGPGGYVTDYDAMPDWKAFGAPTYLTQADILQQLGPHLSVRGDTFIIRTYGEKTDPQGKVLAKAWCESVVQRTPDFVDGRAPNNYSTSDPGNHAIEPLNTITSATPTTLTPNPRISNVNLRMGRHFTITSFRWLQSNEI